MRKITQEELDLGEVENIDGYKFLKYSGLCNWINSKLDTNFKAVFCTRKLTLTKKELDFSGAKLLLVKQDLSYIILTNSEWAYIEV